MTAVDAPTVEQAELACESTYTAWPNLTLHCTGEHLRGNVRRGPVHQAPAGGVSWTWYDDEADRGVPAETGGGA